MQPGSADRPPVPRGSLARTKLLVSLGAAIVVGVAAAFIGAGPDVPLIGWDILALVFCAWVWATVWRLTPDTTASHARREDPSADLAGVVLLGAAIASLIAVGLSWWAPGGSAGPGGTCRRVLRWFPSSCPGSSSTRSSR